MSIQSTLLPLILASGSPRRKELLHALGFPFVVQSSDVDESCDADLAPEAIVEELSLRKANAVAAEKTSGLVLGSDTIVVLDNQVLGKPQDEAEAFRMLKSLTGREHVVFSGVALVDAASGRHEVAHSSTKVRMRPMSDEEILAYIATKEPMDKAGAYAIQGIGATIVEGIVGDYFTVVGLPLALTADLLKRFDLHVL
ncbi:UNVERIFIED_CONTAM: septum formation protein [Brevibacillus sp. OAP136]